MSLILQNTLRIATFNTHKGYTHFNVKFALQGQRALLQKLSCDIVFLQEVQDAHIKHSNRYRDWSTSGQLEYLADSIWPDYAYGKNSVYPAGHHGNAILSKFPIIKTVNQNISAHASEQRGMLHCEINIPNQAEPLHAICLHLGLFSQWRSKQLRVVTEYIEQNIPEGAPLIIAGDFNDWGMHHHGHLFAERLKLKEVFQHHHGKPAKSFPAWLPMLRIDRIYVRGFNIEHVEVHSGAHFLHLSDHAILTATLKQT